MRPVESVCTRVPESIVEGDGAGIRRRPARRQEDDGGNSAPQDENCWKQRQEQFMRGYEHAAGFSQRIIESFGVDV